MMVRMVVMRKRNRRRRKKRKRMFVCFGKHTAERRAADLRNRANAEKLVHKFSAAKRKRIAVFTLGDMVSAYQWQIDNSFIEPVLNVSTWSPSFTTPYF